MKKLSLEKIEQTTGGLSFVDGCKIFAWAVIVSSGVGFGTTEAYIIGSIAFDSCLYQI